MIEKKCGGHTKTAKKCTAFFFFLQCSNGRQPPSRVANACKMLEREHGREVQLTI